MADFVSYRKLLVSIEVGWDARFLLFTFKIHDREEKTWKCATFIFSYSTPDQYWQRTIFKVAEFLRLQKLNGSLKDVKTERMNMKEDILTQKVGSNVECVGNR